LSLRHVPEREIGMYSVYRTHSGKIIARRLTAEEVRERSAFWGAVILIAVGCFAALCVAAGLP